MYFYEPSDPQPCYYCKMIKQYEEIYPIREGIFTSEKIIYRCGWHAKFQCSKCGKFHHFSWLYYCPHDNQLICGDCNPPAVKPLKFWDKVYAYSFRCKECEDSHYDLFFTEYSGIHPWQLNKANLISNIEEPEPWKPNWRPEHLRKGTEGTLEEVFILEDKLTPLRNLLWQGHTTTSELKPSKAITSEDTQDKWEINSKYWIEYHEELDDDTGDFNRQVIIDPVLWELIGDIKGLNVLDAGCGNGYLTRKLTQKGAHAIGVDFSQTFINYCRKKEEAQKLGCTFIQASLDDLSEFKSNSFDLVVSNIVMVDILDYKQAFREIGRILKKKGRFIWSNLHPIFARHGALGIRLPSDTRRREEYRYRIIDRYFETGACEIQWFGDVPLWQFDRTLAEYSKGLKDAGFVISEIKEPKPSTETILTNPHLFAEGGWERFPIFIIIDCLKI